MWNSHLYWARANDGRKREKNREQEREVEREIERKRGRKKQLLIRSTYAQRACGNDKWQIRLLTKDIFERVDKERGERSETDRQEIQEIAQKPISTPWRNRTASTWNSLHTLDRLLTCKLYRYIWHMVMVLMAISPVRQIFFCWFCHF